VGAWRLWAAALAVAAIGGSAQAQSTLLRIRGAGTLTFAGKTANIDGADYAVLTDTHRTSFSVRADAASITFSSNQDLQAATGQAVLAIDTVLIIGPAGAKDEPATGQCQMETADDGARVRTLVCTVTTNAGGAYALTLTGDGSPLATAQ
jgi:hypothetical protein